MSCPSKSVKKPKIKPKNWLFLDTGLDDFRGGAPKNFNKLSDDRPETSKPLNLAMPVVLNNQDKLDQAKQKREDYLGLSSRPKNKATKLDKNMAVLSKQLPRSEQKRNHIQQVETKLLAHPLALYPHLLNSLPNDLINNVSRLLESDVNDTTFSDTDVYGSASIRRSSKLYKDSTCESLESDKFNMESTIRRTDQYGHRSSKKGVAPTGLNFGKNTGRI